MLQVTELNKQLQNDGLASLEGCLALLERNAYQDGKNPTPATIPRGREISDMDHLLRCILSLGQVAVQFGWWCRPHYWDESSERWGEMAMLASSVFEVSIRRLNEVITFYLDHVCAVKSSGLEACDSWDQVGVDAVSADEVNLLDGSSGWLLGDGSSVPFADAPDRFQPQGRFSCQEARPVPVVCTAAASDPSESYTSAMDQPQTYTTNRSQSYMYTACVDQGERSYVTAVDPPESYTTAVVGQLEAYIPDFHQSEVYATAAGQSEAISHSTEEDQSTSDTVSGNKSDQHGLNSEAGTRAVFEYQASGSATDTYPPENSDGGSVENDAATVQSSEVCAVASSWGYFSYRNSSQPYSITATGPPIATEPAVTQAVMVTPSLTRCTQTEDYAFVDVAMQARNTSQPEVEVYYTVEGALATEFTTDAHIVHSPQALYASGESVGEQESDILFTVSHIAESTPDGFTDAAAENYVVSTAVIDDALQASGEVAEVKIEPGIQDIAEISHGSFEAQCETTSIQPQAEMMTEHFEDDALPITVMTESSNVVDGTDLTVADTETIFHNEPDEVNLFTVTVPASHSEGDIVCSVEEVISDAAIMMSETVEIETVGTVEVDGMGGLDPNKVPLAEVSSSSENKGGFDHLNFSVVLYQFQCP